MDVEEEYYECVKHRLGMFLTPMDSSEACDSVSVEDDEKEAVCENPASILVCGECDKHTWKTSLPDAGDAWDNTVIGRYPLAYENMCPHIK